MSDLKSCISCGATARNVSSRVEIEEQDIVAIAQLFAGTYDFDRCGACGSRQATHPEIRFYSEHGHVYVRRIMASSLSAAAQATTSYREVASADDLRSIIAEMMSPRRVLLHRMSMLGTVDKLVDWVTSNWTEMTADLFRVAHLITKVCAPGYRTSAPDGLKYLLGPEHIAKSIAVWPVAQALAWGCVADWVCKTPSARLEETLERFIAPGGVLPGTIDIHSNVLFQMGPELSRFHYTAHSVLASACAVASKENMRTLEDTRVLEWTHLFFQLEADVAAGRVSSDLERLKVSAERADSTIPYKPAWDAVSYLIKQHGFDFGLQSIADKAGHPGLLIDIFRTTRLVPARLDSLKNVFASSWNETNQIEILVGDLDLHLRSLIENGHLDECEEMISFAFGLSKNAEQNAAVKIALARYYRAQRQPGRVIERLGDKRQSSDEEASSLAQALLCSERAYALLQLCRLRDAHELAFQVGELAGDAPAPEVWLAVAIILRDTWQPDHALEILEKLQSVASHPLLALEVLEAIAITDFVLGRLEAALAITRGILDDFGNGNGCPGRVRALHACLLAMNGRDNDARVALVDLSKQKSEEPEYLLWEMLALVEMIERDRTHQQLVNIGTTIAEPLHQVIVDASARGECRLELATRHTLALWADVLDPQTSAVAWQEVQAARHNAGVPGDPVGFASLARFAYLAGRVEEGRGLLGCVPIGLMSQYGGVLDVAVASGGTARLARVLRKVVEAIITRGNATDLRIAGELQRDALGRVQSIARKMRSGKDIELLPFALSMEGLIRLAPSSGAIGVLEWVDGDEGLITIFTRLTASEVQTRLLPSPPVGHIRLVSEALSARLANWRPDRPGDPLDQPDWQRIETWLCEQLEADLGEDDHLVILENPLVSELPWHATRTVPWTVSYSSGWSQLIELNESPPTPPRNLGVIWVPRALESASVTEAMERSANSSRALAAQAKLDFLEVRHIEADSQKIGTMMEHCDMLKLLCHGFISPRQQEVAIMIAYEQRLPLANSAAADLPAGRMHRFGWQECNQLSRSPAIIWSGGCPTGRNHIVGLGERLGLFGALRAHGTRSVVAPRWDIWTREVLPVLDDAMQRYIIGSTTLGQALRDACRDATCSRWSAWSLAIEGDWR